MHSSTFTDTKKKYRTLIKLPSNTDGYKVLLVVLFCTTISCVAQGQDTYQKLYDVDLLHSYVIDLPFLDTETIYSNGLDKPDSDVPKRQLGSTGNGSYSTQSDKIQSANHSVMNNTLLLVTYNTYCGFCISELDFWNEWVANQNNTEQPISVKLIVVEESIQNVRNFIQRNSYKMQAYHDSAMLMRNWVESYQIPLKIFINAEGVVADVRPMGINENLNRYVSSVLK